jgi:hypothetical protein
MTSCSGRWWNRLRPFTAVLSPALMAFNSVAVSVIFIAMRRGSCDGKTWETKRMAISISLDAFLRSSRSLKPG